MRMHAHMTIHVHAHKFSQILHTHIEAKCCFYCFLMRYIFLGATIVPANTDGVFVQTQIQNGAAAKKKALTSMALVCLTMRLLLTFFHTQTHAHT